MTIDLPLITKDGIEGYAAGSLLLWMTEHGLGDAWAAWYQGQTGIIIDGKYVVFKHDAERFLRGLPDADLL